MLVRLNRALSKRLIQHTNLLWKVMSQRLWCCSGFLKVLGIIGVCVYNWSLPVPPSPGAPVFSCLVIKWLHNGSNFVYFWIYSSWPALTPLSLYWLMNINLSDFTFMWPCCIVTNFFIIKPTRCTNFTNLLWHETLRVSDSSSVHHQEFIHCTLSNVICHRGL